MDARSAASVGKDSLVRDVWDYRPCVWDYRESTWTMDRDLVGYDVEATDGRIGTIDLVANEASGAYVVVDTASWIIGKRLVPAGAVASLDHGQHLVQVALTKDQLVRAPDFAADEWDDDIRTQHEDYYTPYSREPGDAPPAGIGGSRPARVPTQTEECQ